MNHDLINYVELVNTYRDNVEEIYKGHIRNLLEILHIFVSESYVAIVLHQKIIGREASIFIKSTNKHEVTLN